MIYLLFCFSINNTLIVCTALSINNERQLILSKYVFSSFGWLCDHSHDFPVFLFFLFTLICAYKRYNNKMYSSQESIDLNPPFFKIFIFKLPFAELAVGLAKP